MDQKPDIQRQIEKIKKAEQNNSYDEINEYLTQKRINWVKKNKDKINKNGSVLKGAYELLLITYMGIDPKEVPIAYEDGKKIIWHSYNFCPVLEACKRLKIDSRKVCKNGWEKSVDAFVKEINPKLRFSRNYKTLRPHGEYCEETIEFEE